MSKTNDLFRSGIIKTKPNQGKYVPPRDVEKENMIRDFCLNCTKPFCKGKCDDIIKYERKIRRGL